MDIVDSVLATPRPGEERPEEEPAAAAVDDEDAMDEGDLQVRTMEVPRWLSTPEVTRHLVGDGKKQVLEEEYESIVVVAGHGSGSKDPKKPGYHLPHLLVTMSGTDVRQLGRLRRAMEDSLIQYVIENSNMSDEDDDPNPPPSLGRLLYSLGLSAANASPKTKDHGADRTVLTRSHFPISLHRTREERHDGDRRHLATRKVWMNVLELPQDSETNEYHGRFLASKHFMTYYKSHFHCRVDIYGVWGDEEKMMCAPYVCITSSDKVNVDKCIQYVEHRIRDHEEKFGVAREGGRRVLRGERTET